MIKIRPNPLPPFRVLYDLPKGTWLVVNVGGRGGGKSHEVSKFGIVNVLAGNKRLALLRDEQSTIAQSILHEIKMRYNEINAKCNDYYNQFWDMQTLEFKNRKTGIAHIFNKGFKTSNNAKKATLKSVSDVDIAIVEEFEDIASEEKFNTFADSIRKEGAIILINSNVPHKNHWFVKRYYNLKDLEHLNPDYKGFYELIPKDVPGVVYIYSNYLDNPFLTDIIKARYEAYGDPTSPMYNLRHYLTDIKGFVSEGKIGRIYTGWTAVSDAVYNSMPYEEYYGLDFGFSADPAAVVAVKTHNRRNFFRELIYEPGLTNKQLAIKLKAKMKNPRAPIYADSAEPKSIKELQDEGLNVIPADKGPDSVDFGIKFLQDMENYATQNSKNLWNENEEYVWELDAEKNPTNKPVDKNNHLKDAARYATTTHKGVRGITASGNSAVDNDEKPSKLKYLEDFG